jgi:uncharacterized phage protein (TIGR01671 family)
MYDVESLSFFPSCIQVELWGLEDLYTFLYSSEVMALMQYTGVEDKNGKDAYEGDIVELLDEDGNTDLCTISFREGNFCYDIFNSQGQRTMSYPIGNEHTSDWHVVGNIFENSELLPGVNHGEKEAESL